MNDNEFSVKNGVRIWLINKKYEEGLDSHETDELEKLQRECMQYRDERYPLPLPPSYVVKALENLKGE